MALLAASKLGKCAVFLPSIKKSTATFPLLDPFETNLGLKNPSRVPRSSPSITPPPMARSTRPPSASFILLNIF